MFTNFRIILLGLLALPFFASLGDQKLVTISFGVDADTEFSSREWKEFYEATLDEIDQQIESGEIDFLEGTSLYLEGNLRDDGFDIEYWTEESGFISSWDCFQMKNALTLSREWYTLRNLGFTTDVECFDFAEGDALPGSVWLGDGWWWADWTAGILSGWAGSYHLGNAPWYYMGEEFGWWYVPEFPRDSFGVNRYTWQFAVFSHQKGGWYWINTYGFPGKVYDLAREEYISF